MKKKAFKMKLYPGFKEEYKRRHDAIWPELKALLTTGGVSDYSIFLDEETHSLFAVQSCKENAPSINEDPVIRKWWDFMADIMETNPDNSPVVIPMEQMFYMD
ncbi:L-rhamnose mutarotase [Lacibacter sediminis]|uniref:L-rhamnose mutarotase n=1 Tax=Lacibacter sediminis TaxID=2760713 RepID=A0A7G5XDA2_9BACT|nr:L-rhamnose mutarotase [Lacibacter sediminis]QNA43455.1 L-rhamnose mutarotase [Lacibacter sediminis]